MKRGAEIIGAKRLSQRKTGEIHGLRAALGPAVLPIETASDGVGAVLNSLAILVSFFIDRKCHALIRARRQHSRHAERLRRLNRSTATESGDVLFQYVID